MAKSDFLFFLLQLVHENQNMMRKSKMMNESSAPNERLEKALQEIDDLSSKLSKERSENAKKVIATFYLEL